MAAAASLPKPMCLFCTDDAPLLVRQGQDLVVVTGPDLSGNRIQLGCAICNRELMPQRSAESWIHCCRPGPCAETGGRAHDGDCIAHATRSAGDPIEIGAPRKLGKLHATFSVVSGFLCLLLTSAGNDKESALLMLEIA